MTAKSTVTYLSPCGWQKRRHSTVAIAGHCSSSNSQESLETLTTDVGGWKGMGLGRQEVEVEVGLEREWREEGEQEKEELATGERDEEKEDLLF